MPNPNDGVIAAESNILLNTGANCCHRRGYSDRHPGGCYPHGCGGGEDSDV